MGAPATEAPAPGPRRRWLAFLLVSALTTFAAGPLTTFVALEPLLLAEGVFAGPQQQAQLDAVYSLGMGVALVVPPVVVCTARALQS